MSCCGNIRVFTVCGFPIYPCGSGCASHKDETGTIYLLPKKINLEKETITFEAFGGSFPKEAISFKEIRRYQKGKFDRLGSEYKIAGIKINKNGELKFNKKYKDEIQDCEGGKKAWKRFKKMRDEIEEQLEESKAMEEEEYFER